MRPRRPPGHKLGTADGPSVSAYVETDGPSRSVASAGGFGDDAVHLLSTEGPQGRGTDVARPTELQERRGAGFLVRRLDDGHEVVRTDGPVNAQEIRPDILGRCGEGLGALPGVLVASDPLIGPVQQ